MDKYFWRADMEKWPAADLRSAAGHFGWFCSELRVAHRECAAVNSELRVARRECAMVNSELRVAHGPRMQLHPGEWGFAGDPGITTSLGGVNPPCGNSAPRSEFTALPRRPICDGAPMWSWRSGVPVKNVPWLTQNSALPTVLGCSSTSRMLEMPVRYMTMRSKPRP